MYSDHDLLVGFFLDRSFPYVDILCLIRSEVGKEASDFYGTQRAGLGTVEVVSIVVGPISRAIVPPPTGLTSACVAAMSSLVPAVVTVNYSFSKSAPVPMVSTTVAITSSVFSDLPSLLSVGPSSVPPLPLHGNTVLEHVQGPMYLI